MAIRSSNKSRADLVQLFAYHSILRDPQGGTEMNDHTRFQLHLFFFAIEMLYVLPSRPVSNWEECRAVFTNRTFGTDTEAVYSVPLVSQERSPRDPGSVSFTRGRRNICSHFLCLNPFFFSSRDYIAHRHVVNLENFCGLWGINLNWQTLNLFF